ncbi:MAG: DAK2 domain-containing protein [Lachnospiraceae bacterium]|nr:DAK2 domain-containing protein [Lachnospiraceae bacterium]
MAILTIDAALLKKMFLSAAGRISEQKEWINELNVFPVPDGDTGTNMTMTIMSAARDVAALKNPTMDSLAKAISMGALKGARGNSGVILSQLFRGFTKEIKDKKVIDMRTAAQSFVRATETAYKAVMKPKEGTILTVARGVADKAMEAAGRYQDIAEAFAVVIRHGDAVLASTPEMLPVLKQAGVVDSGGQGLMEVLRGAYEGLTGKERDLSEIEASAEPKSAAKPGAMSKGEIDTADIKFGYCTEFIVMANRKITDKDEKEFKAYLESIGDSVVYVSEEDVIKIHVHTNDPGLALQKGLTYGQLTRMKIDNLHEEHNEILQREQEKKAEEEAAKKQEEAKKERKPVGFISVSVGEGLSNIFKELGADCIIEGGQTMNPSTEDMLNAIEKVNADTIFILPNNSNIILAANQARDLTEDKEIIVVPTKSIPQGVSALINYVEGESGEENLAHMTAEIEHLKSGQTTYAIRDTELDGKVVKKGNIMGIADGKIRAVGEDIEGTTLDLIGELVDEESSLITVYYGQEIDEETAEKLKEKAVERFPDCEVEVEQGGQPVYYYFVSVE